MNKTLTSVLLSNPINFKNALIELLQQSCLEQLKLVLSLANNLASNKLAQNN